MLLPVQRKLSVRSIITLFLSEGWFVWGLGECFALVGCGVSTRGRVKFLLNSRSLICNFTEHVSLLRVFLVHFAEADYLLGFYVY